MERTKIAAPTVQMRMGESFTAALSLISGIQPAPSLHRRWRRRRWRRRWRWRLGYSPILFERALPHGWSCSAHPQSIKHSATPTDVTQQSARSKFDRRTAHVNYSLAATPAIPANSHQARASAFQYWRCPPASGESPPVATIPAFTAGTRRLVTLRRAQAMSDFKIH